MYKLSLTQVFADFFPFQLLYPRVRFDAENGTEPEGTVSRIMFTRGARDLESRVICGQIRGR